MLLLLKRCNIKYIYCAGFRPRLSVDELTMRKHFDSGQKRIIDQVNMMLNCMPQ